MAELDFQPYRRSIEELLTGSDYYIIPRFQRPYSWDQGNVDEFWRDTLDDNELGYFIGPMVAWRSGRAPELAIVDGQQRLTTITILLAVLRNAFDALEKTKLADGLHRYIERPDRDNEMRFVLQPEVTTTYLNNSILSRETARAPRLTPANDEEKAIQRAFKDLSARVESINKDNSNEEAETFLRSIRDKVLGLRVIWVEHGNEDDAYIVFETLNTRGKDLEVVDLLKNYLLSKLRRGRNKDADQWRDAWNSMRNQISESGADLDANRYILHWWLSHEPYVAQRKLFTAIKQRVKSQNDAESRLVSLEENSPWYRSIFDPSSAQWPFEERELPGSLEALNVFRVVQPAPLVLALLRARRQAGLKMPQIKKALRTIENFHYQYTAITQLSSSGGVSEMYAKYAREMTAATSAAEQADVVTRLGKALNDRKPERSRFVSAFTERLVFTNEITREKRLVTYTLRRMLEASHPNTSGKDVTIEHILPQNLIETRGAELIGNIGNLVLVDEKTNSKLDNKSFALKQPILAAVSSHFDVADIIAATNWDQNAIEARAVKLGELAYDKIWRLPVP